MNDLLALIGRDTQLRRTAATHGGEYSGPCPLCRRGTDRFKVWPHKGQWACLGASAGRGGCDVGGDAIEYLRRRDGLSYREACDRLGIVLGVGGGMGTGGEGRRRHTLVGDACAPRCGEPLVPPDEVWQTRGRQWAARCALLLWEVEGQRARDYLRRRGIQDDILRTCHIGYNPEDTHDDHAAWGLAPPASTRKRIWLPRGITFPWFADGRLWRLNIRRPLTPAEIAAGQPKYLGPPGFANGLYNADALAGDPASARPAVLVEGELDALTVAQACGDLVAAVATGSTAGGRRLQWIARLAQAPRVLVAFDVDDNQAGDEAARWWLQVLPRAVRWRPLLHDVNSAPGIEDVRAWVQCGLT